MRRSLTISLIAILVVTIASLGATLLSGESPRLGLDLQGGASVVLSPKTAVSAGAMTQAQRIITQRVDGLGVAEPNIERQGNNIVVELPGVKDAAQALTLIGQTAELQFRPVQLDPNGQEEILAGAGPPPSATAPPSPIPGSPATTVAPGAAPATNTGPPIPPATTTGPPTPPSTAAALGPARRGPIGVASATAAVPAAAPGSQARSGLLASAVRPAAQTAPTVPAPAVAPAATTGAPAAPSTTTPGSPATTVPVAAAPTAATSGPPITPDSVLSSPTAIDQPVVLPSYTGKDITARYVLGPVLRDGAYLLTGQIVSSAQAQIDNAGQWSVGIQFTGKGGAEWDSIVATQYFQKYVAIVLDNRVISAPQINARQFNGQANITGGGTGGFTHSQASQLALVLRYGALPVQLVQSDVQTVSASLGTSSLRAGLIAGFIGLALVLLYMILYYRALGIVVVVGLAMSGALLYALYTYLGNNTSLHESLSLASVVGIIVSVGVTADSYIVYFERLKDDIRAGKSIRSSVDKSFSRAWRTIWTADLVSIIAAGLLFWLTIGAVRGFAFSLGLSTALDLLTAYTFTRPMVYLLGRNRAFTEARFLGVARGLAAAPAGASA